jgi:hypothetical protein
MSGLRPRVFAILLASSVALAAGGCGHKVKELHRATTEGPYVTVAGLKYQVQISRQLNPQDVEDRDYFRGVPKDQLKLAPNETWFGVFVSVFNDSKTTTLMSAGNFTIEDTLKKEFMPVSIDPALNAFAYVPADVPKKGRLPSTESLPGSNGIGGTLLLFRLSYASLANRPLELHISNDAGDSASIDLDV